MVGSAAATDAGAGLRQLVLLEFLGPALRLGVDGLLFAGEAHLCNQPAVLPGGTGPAEQVSPDCFSGFVLALEDGHQFTTSTSGWRAKSSARRETAGALPGQICLSCDDPPPA